LMPYVSPDFVARVEKFVRAGGVWICGPVTGTRTAEHTVPTDAGLGAVEALAGVETVYSYPATGTDAVGEAFGLTAPLAGWCSALRAASPDTKVVGTLQTNLAKDVAFLTERRIGAGAVVVLGAQPDGAEGRKLLDRIVAHYAGQAKVGLRFAVTPGTLVCPRVTNDGHALWVVINMDGQGGEVTLSRQATDALSGTAVAAGALSVGRYEWRVLRV
jgi:beta-galactosidase